MVLAVEVVLLVNLLSCNQMDTVVERDFRQIQRHGYSYVVTFHSGNWKILVANEF